jgi:Tfp pilus assembly protein PilF
MSTNYNLSKELGEVVSKARELAIEFKQDCIGSEHIFGVMLKIECNAKKYLGGIDIESWMATISDTYERIENYIEQDSLPLTVQAERNIKHAYSIAKQVGINTISSIDLLLSILSYNNVISETLKKQGIIFEDVILDEYGKEILKFSPSLNLDNIRKLVAPKKSWIYRKTFADEDKLDTVYQNVSDLYLYEQYDDCIEICNLALSNYENPMPDFLIYKAFSILAKREFNNALPLFIKIHQAFPEVNDYTRMLAYIYDELRVHEQSEILFNKLLELDSNDAVTLNDKGFSLIQQEKYSESVYFLEKATEIEHELAYSWNNLGYANFKLGNNEKGIELINKSLEIDKGNAYAYSYLGLIYLSNQNKNGAKINFQKALRFGYTKLYGTEVLNLIDKI